MRYLSTRQLQRRTKTPVSLKSAVSRGLASDGGLYLPQFIPELSAEEIADLKQCSFPELASRIASLFTGGELAEAALSEMIHARLPFTPSFKELEPGRSVLELFTGPTLAFKDYGAQFMAGLLELFRDQGPHTHTIILAATSGDTGSAVGRGFYDCEGFSVVLLFPRGQVSPTQEAQLTSIGKNVHALRVAGNFDQCQAMVKGAFRNRPPTSRFTLSSANSINIARLIPQSFYYAYCSLQGPEGTLTDISVPSGNFGNLTAGIIAKRIGFPLGTLVAATNANNIVPHYLDTRSFIARSSVATKSNAMDVGNPSNFERIRALYGYSYKAVKQEIRGAFFSDEETEEWMKALWAEHGYLSDPHTAIGYGGLLSAHRPKSTATRSEVFLSTAHPAKFPEVVQPALGTTPPIPERLQKSLDAKKSWTDISPELSELLAYLNDNFG